MKAIESNFPVVLLLSGAHYSLMGPLMGSCFCIKQCKVVLIFQWVDIIFSGSILLPLKLMNANKPYLLRETFCKKESFGSRT